MSFYMHLEVESGLPPDEFWERVIFPLGLALEREGLGRILDRKPEDGDGREGVYELALEVSDAQRARLVAEEVLRSFEG
jgi:hypothetical protein